MSTKAFRCDFHTKDDGGQLDEGEFIAYPSTFTRTPDSYGDVVAKGAFADSIKAWKDSGDTMPVLYGHRIDDPAYNIGGVTDMGEDDHGLWIRGRLDLDNPKAAQTYRLIKERRLTQLSFAYDVLDEGGVTLDDGTKANELRRIDIHEASFVPNPANPDTGIVAIKAGRELSAANMEELSSIADDLTGSAKRIKDLLGRANGGQDKPTTTNRSDGTKAGAKDEEPHRAKSEEPDAQALDLAIRIALIGQEGE